MIPDPHQDDHPETMLGIVILSTILLAAIGIISYFLLSGFSE